MREMIERRSGSRRCLSSLLAAGALLAGLGLDDHDSEIAGGVAAPDGDRMDRGRTGMTTMEAGGLDAAVAQVRLALAAMGSGDPQPYIDTWANDADVPLFGAWGPIEHGHQPLVDTFRWVGHRFSGGALVPEDVVTHASGDLAYTVGFERGEVSVDGGPAQPMTIRVTQIYRRIDGEWRLVHRHADFPPADQRQGGR